MTPYFYIIVGLPKEPILHQANMNMLGNLAILGIATLVAMSLAWVFGNLVLINPINRLVAATQRFGMGKMDTRTNLPHSPDELGRLARSFDDMASLLETRDIERERAEEALNQAYAEMEESVQERTAELTASNSALMVEITERKRAEEALWEHFYFLQTLIDTIPNPIFYKNVEGIYLGCNKALADFLGLPKEEIIGKSVYDIYSKDLADKYSEMDAALFRQPGVQIYDFSMDHTDGTRRDINFHKATYSTADGTLAGLVGNMIDITQRKQAEEALRESEKNLRGLLDANPESLLLVDKELIVIIANQTAAQRLGKRLDELIGVRLYDLFSRDLTKRRRAYFDEAIRTGQPVQFEDIREGINFYIYAHPVLDAAGKVSRLAILGIDITERKRAENSIKENLRLRQQILDTIPSPIFYKGIDGRYQGVNQAFLQFYGKTMEQVLGKTVHEVFPKEIADKYFQVNQHHWQHPGPQIYEYHTYDAQGQRREVVAHNATFMDKNGSIAGLAGVMIDITEQKKAEEERLRFSKLESLSTLAGGIAHDFNNILTAILGNIGLAMLDGKIEDRVQERLARAEQACLRAQSLSQQLLTFAKGGAPMIKSISIAKLLKESPILALSGSKSSHEVSIPDDLWSMEADEAQINQVISNLLINADQAMPRGGIIKIKAENCLVAAESNLLVPKGKYVKFTIADQGMGIPPKHLDQIFDPYFSTKQKGNGLGLATAYSIIKNHSGHIQVESELGVGATFHIYLPATDKEVRADELETAKPTMGQGKVLVMDDEEMVREVLGGMLSRLGYEVDFASDGSQALEKFVQAQEANQAFAAVILDLTIPGGMGGKETIQGLLKIDPQVKAIVSSGYSDDPIMADFQKYGFSEVIAKPYRVAELSQILQKVILGKKAN